jgi:hypothetical protein
MKNMFVTVLKCCFEFYKNLAIGLKSFEYQMQKLWINKEKKGEKKYVKGPRGNQPAQQRKRPEAHPERKPEVVRRPPSSLADSGAHYQLRLPQAKITLGD